MGQSVAVLVGVPVGAYVAAHFSWRLNYAAIAAMAAAAALVLYLRLPKGMHGDTQTMRDRIRVLGNPGVVPALMVTLLFIGGSFPLVIYVGAFMGEVGIDLAMLPVVLLSSGIGALVASLSAGRIADALGNRMTVSAASLMLIIGMGAFALVPQLPPDFRLPVLLVINAVQGYVGWGYWIAHCSQMAHLAPSSVPVAISLDMAALNIGMAIAAAAGGLVVDNWGAVALPYSGAPFAVLALVVWLSIRELPAGKGI
jgi:predicted MFS family arabinose efflux permease